MLIFQSMEIIPHISLQSAWFCFGRTIPLINLAFFRILFVEVGTNLVPLLIETEQRSRWSCDRHCSSD